MWPLYSYSQQDTVVYSWLTRGKGIQQQYWRLPFCPCPPKVMRKLFERNFLCILGRIRRSDPGSADQRTDPSEERTVGPIETE